MMFQHALLTHTKDHQEQLSKFGNHGTTQLSLDKVDPEMYEIIGNEKRRQGNWLELVASENFTSQAVLQTLGSCLTNKNSESYPGLRYYGGSDEIDKMERLCQARALDLFGLDPEQWGVNVQPHSGSHANFAVYTALVGPHGRIMGLDLLDGGHLTHGFMLGRNKISATSVFFESMPYKMDSITGRIDYEKLMEHASMFKPEMIVAGGASCYVRNLDYEKFQEIADRTDSLLMADMSHVCGLVAANKAPSPFEHCDIVTTTTCKTLRGPRAGLIFYRKGVKSVSETSKDIMYDYESKINAAVFPGLQGAPHNNTIAAVAVALKLANTNEFRQYAQEVIDNARTLCGALMDKGYTCVSGGTDNHMIWVDLRPTAITGAMAEEVLQEIGVACNKNTVPGDTSVLNPSGVRFGTPALTSRGMKPADFEQVAEFLHKGIGLAREVKAASEGETMKDFKVSMEAQWFQLRMKKLRSEVQDFVKTFPMPGYEHL